MRSAEPTKADGHACLCDMSIPHFASSSRLLRCRRRSSTSTPTPRGCHAAPPRRRRRCAHHRGDARRRALNSPTARRRTSSQDHRDAGGRAGRHVRAGERRRPTRPTTRRRGEVPLFETWFDEKDDAARERDSSAHEDERRSGGSPSRTARGAPPHDHRRRLERARGEAARAEGGKIRPRGGECAPPAPRPAVARVAGGARRRLQVPPTRPRQAALLSRTPNTRRTPR